MKLDKPKYLMKCGHIAIATLYDKPCCIFCTGPTSRLIDREIFEDTDGLEGRKAKCYWCKKLRKVNGHYHSLNTSLNISLTTIIVVVEVGTNGRF